MSAGSEGANLIPLDKATTTEIKLLKETLKQEQHKRELFVDDFNKQHKTILNLMNSYKTDCTKKMKMLHDEILEQLGREKDQQKKLAE